MAENKGVAQSTSRIVHAWRKKKGERKGEKREKRARKEGGRDKKERRKKRKKKRKEGEGGRKLGLFNGVFWAGELNLEVLSK
jgi:hypothetical protein